METRQRHLRDAADLLAPSVDETIGHLRLEDQDVAAVALARRYAAAIDAVTEPAARAGVLRQLGPLLLAVLESLGATPAARVRLLKGGTNANVSTGLQRFRESRTPSD